MAFSAARAMALGVARTAGARPRMPTSSSRKMMPMLQGARPYITVIKYNRDDVLAKLDEYHATVMSAN
ncbi:unnamed protein product [Polarella glacialis]|uniref:Uncharacterized protein n=1 Tax=Polarella glacialis TaxID=89957 RepID=A0A813JHM9_POLGL|nr:unnamed protein product [Polarella glacialis]